MVTALAFNVLKKKTDSISVIFNLNSIFSLYSEQLGQITEIHTKNKENEDKEWDSPLKK